MANDDDIPDSIEGIESLESNAGREGPAELRANSIMFRQFYVSLTHAGFSSSEALELVKVVIKSAIETTMRGDS